MNFFRQLLYGCSLTSFQPSTNSSFRNFSFQKLQKSKILTWTVFTKMSLQEIFTENIQRDVQRASFASKKQAQLHIAKPRVRKPAPIVDALPDLAPVVHRVDNNYSPKWRWLVVNIYRGRELVYRVSQKFIPLISFTITFGQKLIFT